MTTTTDTAECAGPPPLNRLGGRVWERRLSPFIDRPGWHPVEGQHARSMVTMLNRAGQGIGGGAYGYRLPPGRWEFTGRSEGCEPGRVVIYAHYLGPEQAAS